MKKLGVLSVVVTLMILLGLSLIVGGDTADKASYGTQQKSENFVSQTIQSDDTSFVIYQNIFNKKFQIQKIEKDLNDFQLVGTVNSQNVFSFFKYMENEKQYWGMEPLLKTDDVEWTIPVFQANGSFLAAGSSDTEIFLSILGEDQKTVTEYAISLVTPEAVWVERKDFCLTEGQNIRIAAYDENVLLIQLENGKSYSCDVVVKEINATSTEVLESAKDNSLLSGAENTWKIYAMVLAMPDCLLPSLILAFLVVIFLYGCSKKEVLAYRVLCITQVISSACFIVVGYFVANTVIHSEIFTVKEKTEIILCMKAMVYILLAIVTFVHVILLLVVSYRWRKFSKAMEYVATEKKAYPEVPVKNDGMQMLWTSLDTIGRNMSKTDYMKEQLYKSYIRFVPKGMEILLQKSETSELSIGDYDTLNGCMVHCSIENIKDYDVSQYMSVMTESLQMMHHVKQTYGGIYHASSADLLERKVFFQDSPEKALSFAIDLIHSYAKSNTFNEVDFIFTLHMSNYFYGISGVEDMMTPFIYCKEEKYLEPYVKTLAKAKVKIALTKQMLDCIGNGFSIRYIGFIQDENSEKIEIYECLDAYSEKKRVQMELSDAIFQNAIKLFYSNDFYLARNAFNEVLKINEQDQIARWYLFDCEYHLNHPEAECSYGLFENMGG